MQLVVLAAGMGSRFGGLKQMEPMDDYGNFLIDYSIVDAKKAGFDSVVFIVRKDFYEEFKNTIGKRAEQIIKVEYAFQELNDLPEGYKCPNDREKPWGTAHAIYAARDVIKEDFIIINGDDYYGSETYKVAYNYLNNLPKGSKGRYANVGFEVVNTITEHGSVKRGVLFEDNNHKLVKLTESNVKKINNEIVCSPLDGSPSFSVKNDQTVSMNLFCFNIDIMDQIKNRFNTWIKNNINVPKSEFLIPSLVDELVNEGKATVEVLKTPSKWFGVTYKEDKPTVVKALEDLRKKGVYKEALYK